MVYINSNGIHYSLQINKVQTLWVSRLVSKKPVVANFSPHIEDADLH